MLNRVVYLHCGDVESAIPYYRDLLIEFRRVAAVVEEIDLNRGILKSAVRLAAASKQAELMVFSRSFAERLHGTDRVRHLSLLVSRFKGRKVGFLANEHRDIIEKLRLLDSIGCEFIVTQYPVDRVRKLYQSVTKGEILSLFHSMSREWLETQSIPWKNRAWDVSFRGMRYPLYLGHQERTLIHRHLKSLADRPDNRLKISIAATEAENSLPGAEYFKLLLDSRCVMGGEAGGDFLDFDNSIRKKVNAFADERSKAGKDTTFEDVERAFKREFEHARSTQPSGRVVSSRLFEAAGARCLQVLFEGEYCGMFQPWTHYVPLKTDFSNWGEVENCMRDETLAARITDAMYTVCAEKYRQDKLMDELVEQVLSANRATS
jgi:hypothetical protein